MCRIAAIASKNVSNLSESLDKMLKSMHRGGPDDSGFFSDIENGVLLGHNRLSIIDLTKSGHQPMSDCDNNFVIIYNGEIYNYKQLKEQLIFKGYQFSSDTDTEVILNGYKQWGCDFFINLEGMFAFIIYDKLKKEIIACRDSCGIKPLYYSSNQDTIIFSSETKTFLEFDSEWAESEDWKIWFLTFGFLPEPNTTLEKVYQLPKGSYMKFDLNSHKYSINSYYEDVFTEKIKDKIISVNSLKNILTESIKSHLISDVPTGVLLSGGLDSSIIATVAQKFNKGNLNTLSIFFDDEMYSEKQYQDIVIKDTGVLHHQFKINNQDYIDNYVDFFRSMDQPTIDGLNTYFISKHSKEIGLKVVLSGLGADELFGGYNSFSNVTDKYKNSKYALSILASINNSYPLKKIKILSENRWYNDYLLNRLLFIPEDVSKLLGISIEKINSVLLEYEEPSIYKTLKGLNKVSFLEKNIYMQNQLLRDSDIFSMCHGVELRVPFLDKNVVELAQNISPEIKFSNVRKKDLLIEAFKNEIDSRIWDRKKRGFTFPLENWEQPFDLRYIEKKWIKKFEKKQINYSRFNAINIVTNFSNKNHV